MTTCQTSSLNDIIESSTEISVGHRSYFQERLRLRLYEAVIKEFIKEKEAHGLTQKALARRLNKRPEQINRWLSSPGNWTIDTVSDLLLGISASEPVIGVSSLRDQAMEKYDGQEELKPVPKWATAVPHLNNAYLISNIPGTTGAHNDTENVLLRSGHPPSANLK